MHHGSARNCWINPSNTPGLEMNEGVLQGCKNFFATFSADVYSISGNTLSGNPNPDSVNTSFVCNGIGDLSNCNYSTFWRRFAMHMCSEKKRAQSLQ